MPSPSESGNMWPSSSEEEEREDWTLEERKINAYVDRYSVEKSYKHSLKIRAETVGGSMPKHGEIQLDVVCDAKLLSCNGHLMVERSAIYPGENALWTLEAQTQVFYPETVAEHEELLEAQKQRLQMFFYKVETNWGTEKQHDQRQRMMINVKGRPNREMLHRALFTYQDPHAIVQSLSGNKKAPIPFINEYEMSIDYLLDRKLMNAGLGLLELLRGKNFMNIQSRINPKTEGRNAIVSDRLQEQIQAMIQLEPGCNGVQQLANLTIIEPSQMYRIESLELPKRFCPMPLVRQYPSVLGVHSLSQFLSGLGIVQNRGECKVMTQEKKVQTFDGVTYPMSMSGCYSVLAKDCQPTGDDKTPRFAVLMKSLKSGHKKVKILTKKNVIEVEPNPSEPHVLLVKVDGQQYTSEEISQQRSQKPELQGLEFSQSGQHGEAVIVDSKDFTVRFNGKMVRIQLSGKNRQIPCGFCGNYDNNEQNDFRRPDGKKALRLSNFQRVYTLNDGSEGCTDESQREFYSEHYDESKEMAGEKNQKKYYDEKLALRDDRNKEKKDDYSDYNNYIDPVEMTLMIEYNHKVCFSLKPHKQCPMGTRPEHDMKKEAIQAQAQYSCLDRKSLEANRIKKQVLKKMVVKEVALFSASFTEKVVIPLRCVKH